jgi:hypothetical protein
MIEAGTLREPASPCRPEARTGAVFRFAVIGTLDLPSSSSCRTLWRNNLFRKTEIPAMIPPVMMNWVQTGTTSRARGGGNCNLPLLIWRAARDKSFFAPGGQRNPLKRLVSEGNPRKSKAKILLDFARFRPGLAGLGSIWILFGQAEVRGARGLLTPARSPPGSRRASPIRPTSRRRGPRPCRRLPRPPAPGSPR